MGIAVFLLGALCGVVRAQDQAPAASLAAGEKPLHDPEGILNLDIEQLAKVNLQTPAMSQEVTSVSRQESTVGRSAAAVYVITSEMIHRSACNSVPDLLRLVPGLDVAQVDAHTWAITSRGFNDRYANKLQVLIDGRTVYWPVFAGVYWDMQDLLLEDIDRIEVIRGPGATMWGANAVNGVINIITKKAKDTQGGLVTYGGGTEDLALGGARVGGVINDDLHWRIYGKHTEHAPGWSEIGINDDWRQGRGGFRADWEPDRDKSNLITFQGDYFQGTAGQSALDVMPSPPYTTPAPDWVDSGGNLLGRWTHVYDEDSDWKLQTYFDNQRIAAPNSLQNVNTFDVEFQDRFPLAQRHEVIWGADYRQIRDELLFNGFMLNYTPPERTTTLFSMFVQDEITLVEDRLTFTVGSKFERNDYTGFEYQPSGRLLYTPDKKHSFWGAISRAVRTPSRFDQDGYLTTPPTAIPVPPDQYFTRLNGSPGYGSEHLMAYELGYRAQPAERFAYDIALYYNVYDDLQVGVPGGAYFDAYGNYLVPYTSANGARANGYGAEILGEWTFTERWRFSTSYTVEYMQWEYDPMVIPVYMGTDPRNQVKAMSSWDLGSHWQFDAIMRYVDTLPDIAVPAYLTMDLRLAWLPNKRLEFAVIGRNLLQNHHPEFDTNLLPGRVTQVERSVFGKITWRY